MADTIDSHDTQEENVNEFDDGDMFNQTAAELHESINCALIESGQQHDDINSRVVQRKNTTSAFKNFRSASLSISMLAKPSDDRKASALLAGWNVSNLIQGTGILGIPYAVAQGGWAAVAMIFFVSFICCHTGKLLIDCLYETSKKTGISRRLRVSYPEIGEAVFGRKGYILVSVVQSIEMCGAVTMYIILLGTAWANVLQQFTGISGMEWAVINCCAVLPTLFITKMSIVAWLSMLSVFSLLAALIVLIAYCFLQIPIWDIEHIPAFETETFPIGFGIIVFSYCAHAVFPSIESSMREANKFNSMMNYSFLLAAIVKGCLGTFMVLTFGKNTAEVATVNCDSHKYFSYSTSGLVIGNVLLAIPLTMFVVSQTFDDAFLTYFPHLNRDTKYHWVWLLITRPLLICFALFLAVMIPHFGILMGVIGNFTGTTLAFLFPCIFHMKLRWHTLKRWQFILEIFIIVFGLLAGGLGLVFSVKALVLTFL